MNKVFIIGRLTRDPELRTTPNGVSVATLSVAVTRRMNREEADFLTVIAWRGLADTCGKYLVKGQQLAVAGEIRSRSYEAKDGSGKRYVTEIQADDIEFLAKPGQGGGTASGGYSAGNAQAAPPPSEGDLFAEEMNGVLVEDEELPF